MTTKYAWIVSRALLGLLLSGGLLLLGLLVPPAHAAACQGTECHVVDRWLADKSTIGTPGRNDGVAEGGLTYAPGIEGYAFALNGIDAAVSVPDATDLHVSAGGFTVMAWVYFNSLTHSGSNCGTGGCAPLGDMSLVDKMNPIRPAPNMDGWRLLKQDDNHFWFCFGASPSNGCGNGAPTTVRSSTTAATGVWYFVAATEGSTSFSIYINGVLEGSKPTPSFTDTNSTWSVIQYPHVIEKKKRPRAASNAS
jgi:hypothetical protein